MWQDLAACAGMDVEIFFPAGGITKDARQVCAMCPVTRDCLEFALRLDLMGVYGNTTRRERRKMQREGAGEA